MTFAYDKLKLNYKLSLLFAIPLALTFALAIFLLWGNALLIKQHSIAISLFCFSIIVSILAATLFIRKLSHSLGEIENISESLATGNFEKIIGVNGLPETGNISTAINLVREGVYRQTKFAEAIKGGDLAAAYEPFHERDTLGKALCQIKDNLVAIKEADLQRNWASAGLEKFVELLQSGKSLKDLSNDLITNLVRTINAIQGAIFILTPDRGNEVLEMQACYAYTRTKHFVKTIAPGEGVIGQAFLEKATVNLTEVPDSFVRITSGLGEANPRHILIVPLKMNETVVGIVELASFKAFQKHEIDFVERIGESIAFTISSIRTADSTTKMVEDLNVQAEQMKAQEEELRQNQEELVATQETISRKYDALFKKLHQLNQESKFDQLKSINSTKKRNIEYYFNIIRNQIQSFAEDKMIIDAVRNFRAAFYSIDANINPDTLATVTSSVRTYYLDEFMARLNDMISGVASPADYIPTDERTLLLQYNFISNNPHPTGKKSLLDDVGNGSAYSKTHASYHPLVRNFLERFGYYDIFLIDGQTGDMLYSVFKEVDFATNLLHGQYCRTNFGRVVKKAVESKDKNFVHLVDFEPYDPSYHAPASFIACPIYDNDDKIGIVVFQMPINKINQILTGDHKWREDGLGESGETVIVGEDYKLRSISRGLIEDPDSYVRRLRKQGYEENVVQQIRKMETNILMESMTQDSVAKALSGDTGTLAETNRAGEDILCAYAPLNIADVNWMITSTLKEVEASERIENLRDDDSDS